ncbi:hypothetical protein Kfla_3785 [Kribbella flavida DSM 17836]|uniref:Secreted protein n=1 Tax=Kribbella flavida (strain DSM 17836 / JCM 10339 / NBRC 14399) TaxID=479435 RepID=D2PPR5_KRIFD|nr:hypothetical protein [Kribbella flavida]ADB32839.1 hypothetical protein Kfla_3785 [Kribbella flavida DSM 17836]
MSRWKRWIGAGFAMVVFWAGTGTAPAQAGGPTSVLLSAPGIPKVVATGYDDPRYAELGWLVGEEPPQGGPESEQDHAVGAYVRAAWLIHDMAVWRLDVIYPDAPGGPWIATTRDVTGSGTLPEKPVWHRAADSVRLVKLLVAMGLLGGKPNATTGAPTSLPTAVSNDGATPDGTATGGVTGGGTTEAHPTGAGATDGSPAAAEITAESAFSGWRWAIPGAILGALLAFVATRFRRSGPRDWELIDQE